MRIDRASPRAEPVAQARKVRAHRLQRRREVELDDVWRLAGDDPNGVFVSQGLRPGFNQRLDLSFGELVANGSVMIRFLISEESIQECHTSNGYGLAID
jgi:hypothetical protein